MKTTVHPVVVGIVHQQPTALRFAAGEARAAKTPLWVFHSTGLPPQAADFAAGFEVLQEAEEAGQRLLEDARLLLDQEAADLDVRYVLSSSPPLQALGKVVEECRLLVLGSDDVPWFERLLRTRIAGHLALHAPCPVIVVPELAHPGVHEGDVVLTLDGDTAAEGPIRFALEQAESRGVPLRVLHATGPRSTQAQMQAHRANLAEVLAGWQEKFPDVRIFQTFPHDDPSAALVWASEGAALVIVGRPHDRVSSISVSRPLAADVLRRAHCPVAVVPAQP